MDFLNIQGVVCVWLGVEVHPANKSSFLTFLYLKKNLIPKKYFFQVKLITSFLYPPLSYTHHNTHSA